MRLVAKIINIYLNTVEMIAYKYEDVLGDLLMDKREVVVGLEIVHVFANAGPLKNWLTF